MEFRIKTAASLIAVFFIFALGANAAINEITYQANFTPDTPISGSIEIRLQNNSIDPELIYVEDSAGRRFSARFQLDKKKILVSPANLPSSISGISVIYHAKENNNDIADSKVFANGTAIYGDWDPPIIQTTGTLLDIIDSLTIGRVAVSDTHSVSFTITTTPIGDSGQVWILFRDGFDISGVSSVMYSDNDPTNDGNEPIITQILNDESAVIFQFQPGGQHAQQDSRVTLKFWPVINDSIAQSYRVIAMTTANSGEIENAPTESALFYLLPDAFNHIDIAPDTAVTLASGTILHFSAIGKDRFENIIPDLDIAIGVTVDSCGIISDGSFQALKLGACYITASAEGLTDSTGLITVTPGPLARFFMIGYPVSRIAGQPFNGDVTVTALDAANNRKYDYFGELWFTTGDEDPIDDLPYEFDNRYTFVSLDSGFANFAGSGFILKRAGIRTLTAGNSSIGVSSSPIRVTGAAITSFMMSAGTPQIAGEAFYVNVDSAQDLYGNVASGEIAITDSIGGGNSPDGFPPSHNNIIVTNGTGRALQVLTNAVPTMLKGNLVGGNALATTTSMQILPGLLGQYLLAGYPDLLVAGDSFPLQVRVTALDIFGNLKTNYSGSIYFTSTDPLAQLPYTFGAPFQFLEEYGGIHSFTEPFSLRTAGGQTISVTDGIVPEEVSQVIDVSPATISQFTLSVPVSIPAGVNFTLNAANALDIWGNPSNGTITVTDSIGGGQSPNGTQPVYNAIQIVSGAGTANQTLVNVVPTTLKGTIDDIIAVTESITVTPGVLGIFDLEISSPQVVGVPFSGEALLTAFDRYGNIKSDYNASQDTVVITSSSDGPMSNNIFRDAGDFNLGVANLVAKGTTYNGRGGPVTFIATSQSHIEDNSNPIDMNAIRCGGMGIDQAILSPGDTATGTISVTNLAGADVNITDLIIFDFGGWVAHPNSYPSLPNQLGPGESRTYNITLPIPLDFPMGLHPLTAGVRGLFSTFSVADTLSGYPDTISIEVESLPVYISNSLNPDTLSSGSYYTLRARIGNDGSAGIALIDTSYLQFTDGIRQFRAAITAPVFLPPNSPAGVSISFDSTLVDINFTAGSYISSFYYFGHENGFFRNGIIALTDSIWIQSRATINYISGSLNIDSLVAGQIAGITIQVNNSGTADFLIRHQDTKLTITDPSHEFAAFSDTSSGNRVDILRPGITTFHFRPTILQSDFTPGTYLPSVSLSGSQNGFQETVAFSTGTDSIKILSPAILRIDSTYAIALNAPFVNTSQPCSLKVLLENLGDEAVDGFTVHLGDNGLSQIPDSIYVPHLEGNTVALFYFAGVAGDVSNSNEIFTSSISGGTGVMSGNPVRINQSLDNTALLVTETPANLSLSDISIVSPPEALDDSIATGQNIVVSVTVHNEGQADINGSQRLFLDYGSIPWGVDSLFRDFELDQPVLWQLRAPGEVHDAATLHILILSGPFDINDGSNALGPDTVSSHTFAIVSRPYISQNGAITSPDGALDGILSSDQTFVISDTLRSGGLYSLRAARLFLPDGFTTQDSLVKYPAEDFVNWRLRAPFNTAVTAATVQSWVIDANTGDSIGTSPDNIPITIVNAAALRISTSISGPPADIDGIVEPGGSLIFQAVVHNAGQAAVSGGEVNLQMTRIDMVPEESPIRNFTIDAPIEWTISLPTSEVSIPIPISASIYTVPLDENTGLPARIITDSSWVSILVRELYPRLMIDNITMHSGSVVRGQDISYLAFELRNNDIGANFPIAIAGFTFEIVSSTPASDLLTSVTMSSDSGQVTVNSFNGNTITIAGDTVLLASTAQINYTLSLTFNSNTAASEFTLKLNHDFVNAVVIENSQPTLRLYALSERGDQLNWQGNPTAILEQSFAASLSSYPNPFNPRVSGTKIGYYLPSPSDLEIRVFTLTGELVWTKMIAATDEFGTAGLHTGQSALTWDGKNDIGKEIRSGVYICIVKNLSTGEEEKFKIAIVK